MMAWNIGSPVKGSRRPEALFLPAAPAGMAGPRGSWKVEPGRRLGPGNGGREGDGMSVQGTRQL